MTFLDVLAFTTGWLIGLVILHFCPPRIGHPTWEAIACVAVFGVVLAVKAWRES